MPPDPWPYQSKIVGASPELRQLEGSEAMFSTRQVYYRLARSGYALGSYSVRSYGCASASN